MNLTDTKLFVNTSIIKRNRQFRKVYRQTGKLFMQMFELDNLSLIFFMRVRWGLFVFAQGEKKQNKLPYAYAEASA